MLPNHRLSFLDRFLPTSKGFAVAMVAAVSLFAADSSSGQGISLAEAIDQPGLEVTSGGDAPWVGRTSSSYDGVDVARAGGSSLILTFGQMLPLRPNSRFDEFDRMYPAGGGTHSASGLPGIFESARISTDLLLKDLAG